MMVIEHRRDMQRTLKLENNRLEEVPETSPKRSRKTDAIPGIHFWNAFDPPQQQATPAKRGQKRDRRKSDTTSTRIRTSGLEGADLNSEATSLGPAEQRCLPSPSDGSSDPDAAVGAPVHTGSALESSDLKPVNINTSTDVMMLCTDFDSQLLDPNGLAAIHEHGTYEAQSGVYSGTGAERAHMIYPQMSDNGHIYSIEQHSHISALQHFQSSYGEPITPSEVSTNSQLPTPISAQPCDHRARLILVYRGACGHDLYHDTHSGNIQHVDFLLPEIPRVSADVFSNPSLFADNFNSEHLNANPSTPLGPQSEPIYDHPLEQGPTDGYDQTIHIDWIDPQRSQGLQLHLNTSIPTNSGPSSGYLQTSPGYFNYENYFT